MRTVLFSPEDLALVKGDPSERRRFLDDLLVLRTPRLAGVRADYDRVLKQRNALLKTAGQARRRSARREELRWRRSAVWDEPSGPARAPSCSRRGCAWSTTLAPLVERPTRRWPGGARRDDGRATVLLELPLEPGGRRRRLPERDALADALLARGASVAAARSWSAGSRLVGPHRDELARSAVGTLPVKGYATHGESGRSRSRCGWRRTSCYAPTATTRS